MSHVWFSLMYFSFSLIFVYYWTWFYFIFVTIGFFFFVFYFYFYFCSFLLFCLFSFNLVSWVLFCFIYFFFIYCFVYYVFLFYFIYNTVLYLINLIEPNRVAILSCIFFKQGDYLNYGCMIFHKLLQLLRVCDINHTWKNTKLDNAMSHNC